MRTPVPCAALAALLAAGLVACDGAAPGEGADAGHRALSPTLPVRVDHDVIVRDARFGQLLTDEAGVETFLPRDELPAVDGTTFGWALRVETDRGTLRWRERLRLPQPPVDWGDAASDPGVAIGADGRSVVSSGVEPVDEGTLSRFYWALAPGDPAGDYLLDVEIEGKLVARFRFRVPAPVADGGLLVAAPAPAPRGTAPHEPKATPRSVAWR